MEARTKLARNVLEMLEHGYAVPTHDALQLRNWAISPQDATLSLKEIAHRILSHQEEPKGRATGQE